MAEVLPPDALAAADALADAHHARGDQPGLAYGVIADGQLVHARGIGEHRPGLGPPDGGTVFRIASMTKSFTAAAVLALRDAGALALDQHAADFVPELGGLRPATADSPAITIRHLLTMTAGFPTDDPWGDRQQGLPQPEFSALLAAGPRCAWAAGTRFEYSNLGYAILGRVIASASGLAYHDYVSQTLLRPLGMQRTGFEARDFPRDDLACGFQRRGSGWLPLDPDPLGAFAPMGGVFSCVSDLARWASGLAAAFPPGGEEAGGTHPLSRATRREIQLPQVAVEGYRPGLVPGGAPGGPVSYGFGLFVVDDAAHGRIVQHSGGYPGFGSQMRWHPDTGLGVVVLANGTYAPAGALAARMLDMLLRRAGAGGASRSGPGPRAGTAEAARAARVRGPAPAPGTPWPETIAARRDVMTLLEAWDDAVAARVFSPNVARDEPFEQRRRDIELIRERLGGLAADAGRPAEFDSPAHCRWWLSGERGTAAVEIRLTPEPRPRVQQLRLAVPAAPGSPLSRRVDELIGLLCRGGPQWPLSLPAAGTLDTAAVLRQFRAAAAWAGACRPGAWWSGDGATSTTVELNGEHARLLLSVRVDGGGAVLECGLAWPA
jgi:CubicO group peptidase (beta-lactamase class C family)